VVEELQAGEPVKFRKQVEIIGNVVIEQDDVGPLAEEAGEGICGIARFADYCEARLTLQQDAESIPYKHVVIDDQYTDSFGNGGRQIGLLLRSIGNQRWHSLHDLLLYLARALLRSAVCYLAGYRILSQYFQGAMKEWDGGGKRRDLLRFPD
jgi:hypothetical protein